MSRLSACVVCVGAALLVAAGRLDGAGGTVSGTVKVTGMTSGADAIVYVQQASAPSSAGKTAEMDQKKMQFIPHVLAIATGTTVKFLNSDPTPHNVFSPDNEKYNLGTWPAGQSKDYVFNKCTQFPCVYKQLCRVHPEMEGYIVVLQNPFFAVTDKDGHYEIRDVPPGSYTLATWHPRAKAQTKPVTVDAAKPSSVDFTLAR